MKSYLPDVVPYRTFREGTTDIRGGVMQAYELTGPSPETHTETTIGSYAEQLGKAFSHLGTGDATWIVYHRVPATAPAPKSFTTIAAKLVDDEQRAQFAAEGHWLTHSRLYLAHRFEKPITGFVHALLLANTGVERLGRHELMRDHALNRFRAFEDAAPTGLLRRMSDEEVWYDFLLTVLGCEDKLLLPTGQVRLNEALGSNRFIGGQRPHINDYYLCPVSITMYPTFTVPQMLAVLLQRPGRMTVTARFLHYDNYNSQELLKKERQHWNREILGTLWKVIKKRISKNESIDADSAAQLADIDAAIAACAAGLPFGHVSVTAIVRDTDSDRALLRARDIVRDCHAHGMHTMVEHVNATEAILGSWPGNTTENIRRPIISAANYADIALPVTRWEGL